MAAKYMSTAKKLQNAINQRHGVKLLINSYQWFSDDKNKAITQYSILQSQEKNNTVLFKTYSQIQLVLFLRDYWYTLNGWEVPTDNETWEEVKRQYAGDESQNAIDRKHAADSGRTEVSG